VVGVLTHNFATQVDPVPHMASVKKSTAAQAYPSTISARFLTQVLSRLTYIYAVVAAAAEQCSLYVISTVAQTLVAEQSMALHLPAPNVNVVVEAEMVAFGLQ